MIPYEIWTEQAGEWRRVSASPDIPTADMVEREANRDDALYRANGATDVRFVLFGDRDRFNYAAAEFIAAVQA